MGEPNVINFDMCVYWKRVAAIMITWPSVSVAEGRGEGTCATMVKVLDTIFFIIMNYNYVVKEGCIRFRRMGEEGI